MSELDLKLLGGTKFMQSGTDWANQWPSVKGRAVFIYLAMTPGPQNRSSISTMLWPDSPEDRARASLRVEIARGRIPAILLDYLTKERDTVEFKRHKPYSLDVEAFEALIEVGRNNSQDITWTRLREAMSLYDGEFLAGLTVPDAFRFEEWVMRKRRELERMALQALEQLVDIALVQRKYDEGIPYARKLVQLDGWDERFSRSLMKLLAHAGRHTQALAEYERLQTVLKRELSIEARPETRLLYEQIRDGKFGKLLPTVPPPLPLPLNEAPPFMPPSRVAYFVGREQELERLKMALTQIESEERIFCLVGMGGVGKTTLSVQLAHQLKADFPDGVLWANAATTDPTNIAERWAAAYQYDFSGLPDLEGRAAALRQVLAEKKALLIFDDVAIAAKVQPLIPITGPSKVLLSSRSREVAEILDATVVDLTELSLESSRQLLMSIVGKERTEAEKTAVDEICRLLHNLPLAVAIAGQYLSLRPRRRLEEFRQQLQEEKNRLNLYPIARHDREVRATFAISWEGLDETPRHVFATLAVFAGRPFTAEVVAALLPDVAKDVYFIRDRLQALIRHSLLHEENDGYYRQHPLLADFAHEKLADSEVIYRRMMRYYLDFARAYQQNYQKLRPEWENLAVSIEKAFELYEWQYVLDFTQALQLPWFTRGRFSEARQAYEWAQKSAMALEDERSLADIFFYRGKASLEQVAYEEAKEALEQSLTLYKELSDVGGQAFSLSALGRVELEQSRYEEAEVLLQQSRALHQQVNNKVGVAETIYRQARIQYELKQFETARTLAEEALQMQELVGDQLGMTKTLRLLTQVYVHLHLIVLAETSVLRAMTLSKSLQNSNEEASALLALSTVRHSQGTLELAQQLARESLTLFEKIGDRQLQAQALYRLAEIHLDMRDYDTALTFAKNSLQICKALNDELGSQHVLGLLQKINSRNKD